MRLQLYILRLVLVAFGFTFGGMVVLALPGVAVSAVHKLKGFPILEVIKWLPLALAELGPYLVPLAFLFAVVSAYARLAADNEWTAIRMSGRGPMSVVWPSLAFAFVLQLCTLQLLSEFLPWVRQQQNTFVLQAASRGIRDLAPGRTELQLGEFYLTARRRDGPAFLDAFLHLPGEDGGEARTLRAERVRFRFQEDQVLLELVEARTVLGDHEVRSGNPVIRLDTALLRSEKKSKALSSRYWNDARLETEMAVAAAAGDEALRRNLSFEYHWRRALSATCVVFLLLGLPTGLSSRRGNQLLPQAMAVGLALLYYVLFMQATRQLFNRTWVPELEAAWAVTVASLLCGAWWTRRVLRR